MACLGDSGLNPAQKRTVIKAHVSLAILATWLGGVVADPYNHLVTGVWAPLHVAGDSLVSMKFLPAGLWLNSHVSHLVAWPRPET